MTSSEGSSAAKRKSPPSSPHLSRNVRPKHGSLPRDLITVSLNDQLSLHLKVLSNIPTELDFFKDCARDVIKLCSPERQFESALIHILLGHLRDHGADEARVLASTPVFKHCLQAYLNDLFLEKIGVRLKSLPALQDVVLRMVDSASTRPGSYVPPNLRKDLLNVFTSHCEGRNSLMTLPNISADQEVKPQDIAHNTTGVDGAQAVDNIHSANRIEHSHDTSSTQSDTNKENRAPILNGKEPAKVPICREASTSLSSPGSTSTGLESVGDKPQRPVDYLVNGLGTRPGATLQELVNEPREPATLQDAIPKLPDAVSKLQETKPKLLEATPKPSENTPQLNTSLISEACDHLITQPTAVSKKQTASKQDEGGADPEKREHFGGLKYVVASTPSSKAPAAALLSQVASDPEAGGLDIKAAGTTSGPGSAMAMEFEPVSKAPAAVSSMQVGSTQKVNNINSKEKEPPKGTKSKLAIKASQSTEVSAVGHKSQEERQQPTNCDLRQIPEKELTCWYWLEQRPSCHFKDPRDCRFAHDLKDYVSPRGNGPPSLRVVQIPARPASPSSSVNARLDDRQRHSNIRTESESHKGNVNADRGNESSNHFLGRYQLSNIKGLSVVTPIFDALYDGVLPLRPSDQETVCLTLVKNIKRRAIGRSLQTRFYDANGISRDYDLTLGSGLQSKVAGLFSQPPGKFDANKIRQNVEILLRPFVQVNQALFADLLDPAPTGGSSPTTEENSPGYYRIKGEGARSPNGNSSGHSADYDDRHRLDSPPYNDFRSPREPRVRHLDITCIYWYERNCRHERAGDCEYAHEWTPLLSRKGGGRPRPMPYP